jgi:hypothetical protein
VTPRPCLQNLHPRFKSGRRLQNPSFVLHRHKRAFSKWTALD